MFDAIIQADRLKTALTSVGALVDECKLQLTEDELAIRAVDPANVAMVDCRLDAGAFESYQADGGVIACNLTRLQDVVTFASAGDLVHLELDESTRKLGIGIEGLSYTLALFDPDTVRKEPDIPDLAAKLPATVVFEGRDLARGLKAADLVSDHVCFSADPDDRSFHIEAEGDTDDVDLALGDEELIDADVPEAVSTLFSLDYLADMNKAVPKTAEVRARLGTEFPVKLDFEIAEGQGEVLYMVAPRIESE